MYLPDGTELHAGSGDSTATGTRYYSFLGTTIAVRTSTGLTWLVDDPNGTNTVQIDATTLAATHRYSDPFGESRSALPSWMGDRGFVGGTEDPTTGLTNLGAREYDPKLGRFLSADPIADVADPQQLNGYAYANNSPVIHNDASGQILACGGLGGSDRSLGCKDGTTTPNGNNAGPSSWGAPPGSYVDTSPYAWVGKHGVTLRKLGGGRGYAINDIVVPYMGPTDALAFAKAVDAATGKWQEKHSAFPSGADQSVADTLQMMQLGCAANWGMCSLAFQSAVRETFNGLKAPGRQKHMTTGDKIVGYLALAITMGAMSRGGEGEGEGEGAAGARGRGRGGALGGDDWGGCHSFTPNTPVQLADGTTTPISDVTIGDEILNAKPGSAKSEKHRVDGIIVTTTDHNLVDLTLTTPTGPRTLTTTTHHLFWNATTHHWTQAVDLHPGQQLQTTHGRAITLNTTRHYTATTLTYDLTINHLHTYYVLAGDTPVLVHNSPCEPWTSVGKFDSNGYPVDGTRISTDDALNSAEAWVGPGYTEPVPGSGRFVSADGTRVARMGESDITGQHGGGPHMNFERLAPNPKKPGKMMVVENRHIYLG